MTEAHSIGRRLLPSANQTPELMTSTARREVATVCLSIGRVTTKTSDVSIQPRWNREPHAITVSAMTSGTTRIRMLRVIEPGVETPQRGKRFDLSTLNIGMTIRANRAGRI